MSAGWCDARVEDRGNGIGERTCRNRARVRFVDAVSTHADELCLLHARSRRRAYEREGAAYRWEKLSDGRGAA